MTNSKIGKMFPNLIKIIRDQRKQNNEKKNKIKIYFINFYYFLSSLGAAAANKSPAPPQRCGGAGFRGAG